MRKKHLSNVNQPVEIILFISRSQKAKRLYLKVEQSQFWLGCVCLFAVFWLHFTAFIWHTFSTIDLRFGSIWKSGRMNSHCGKIAFAKGELITWQRKKDVLFCWYIPWNRPNSQLCAKAFWTSWDFEMFPRTTQWNVCYFVRLNFNFHTHIQKHNRSHVEHVADLNGFIRDDYVQQKKNTLFHVFLHLIVFWMGFCFWQKCGRRCQ